MQEKESQNAINILGRIKEAYKIKTDTELASFLEVSQNTIPTWKKRGSVDYRLIIAKCDNINLDWLFTGDGEMSKVDIGKKLIVGSEKEKEEETRPRIPMDAAAGSLTVAADGITANDCEQIPIIRAFARYDFTIFARGDSMEPEYHSGDELACVYIKNTSFIQWGRIHVIDTAQGILVKRIFDGDDYIICKSDNGDYPEFKVHKSEFYNVALVIGMLRRY